MTQQSKYPWTDGGRELLAEVERLFEKGGGYKLFKAEAILENKLNKFSTESMKLKTVIRRLNEGNLRTKR